MSKIRLRFAPSPTGYLHIGGLRTALYSYLFARKHKGDLILRIEDTDRQRKVEGAVEGLFSILDWAGIEFNEGSHIGGDYGPYTQSERLPVYKEAVDELLEHGHAYKCFCSPERLQTLRDEQAKAGSPTGYDGHCRNLSEEEIEKKIQNSQSFVVRMKIPENKTYLIPDLIKGEVSIPSSQIDDQVILKTDGFPTYHLACVVDDHKMKISHVIRGEEWLSSTPKHLQLYEYFGWQAPEFAHMSLLLNMDGTKLSKRQGDVAVEDYKKAGILPEALLNFCAFLGWSAKDDKEIFTIEELISEFDLNRISKSGSKFDIHKLEWFNEQYIHRLSEDRLFNELKPYIQDTPYKNEEEQKLKQVCSILQSSLHKLEEIKGKLALFFEKDIEPKEDFIKEALNSDDSKKIFKKFLELAANEDVNSETFGKIIKEVQKQTGVKGPKLWKPFRYAITLSEHGPDLPILVDFFAKEEVLRRISKFV